MAQLSPDVERRARAVVAALGREGVVRAVYVFGSQVDGHADRWSDIDLAVFMDEVDGWDIWQRIDVIVRVQGQAGYDIEPHLFPSSRLTNAERGSFAADILRRGVRIV
jgi:predicted nucleotidyltransferase